MRPLSGKSLDLQYHLQQAAKAYHANKWMLEDRKVPISQRLRYFDSVVSSVGGLGSAKATHSGGSHPCVVNEFADAVAAWGAGTVGF